MWAEGPTGLLPPHRRPDQEECPRRELIEALAAQQRARPHHPGWVEGIPGQMEGEGHRTGGHGCPRATFVRNWGDFSPRTDGCALLVVTFTSSP
jgi:hypothetical protein